MKSHQQDSGSVGFWRRVALIIALLGPAPAVAAGAATPNAATVQDQYRSVLSRYCPAKHLEWLSEGDRDLAIQEFRGSLSPSRRAELDKIANTEQACGATIVGLECNNIAYVRAALSLNLLPQLAMKICGLPVVCRSVASCPEQR